MLYFCNTNIVFYFYLYLCLFVGDLQCDQLLGQEQGHFVLWSHFDHARKQWEIGAGVVPSRQSHWCQEASRNCWFPIQGKHLILFCPFSQLNTNKSQTAMNALITTLLSCNPHYVRCIKPNDSKKAGTIDEQRIRHQVRYLGYFLLLLLL